MSLEKRKSCKECGKPLTGRQLDSAGQTHVIRRATGNGTKLSRESPRCFR